MTDPLKEGESAEILLNSMQQLKARQETASANIVRVNIVRENE